ncbi:acetyltransferase [Shewanella putrefaciens]|nr:acetyltransferase [Shewanella putrefaciens]
MIQPLSVMLSQDGGRFFEAWPIYRSLLNRLPQLSWDGPKLTKNNSCQYGPIWVHQTYRGTGVFEALVNAIRSVVSPHFSYMLTFIAEENERSFAAHSEKRTCKLWTFSRYQQGITI